MTRVSPTNHSKAVVVAAVVVTCLAAWWQWVTRPGGRQLQSLNGFPAQQLDEHVFLVSNFLSKEEITHLRRIGEAPQMQPSQIIKPATDSYRSVELRRPWETHADPVAAAIESRIGRATGISPHSGDSPLRMTVARVSAAVGSLQNLHHDSNKAPQRVVTALMYLSDADDGLVGGHTIFPCVGFPSEREQRQLSISLCTSLEAAFARGERFLSPPDGIYRAPCFDPHAAQLGSDLCVEQVTKRGEQNGASQFRDGTYAAVAVIAGKLLGWIGAAWWGGAAVARSDGVAFAPRRGDAIIFWQQHNDSVLPHMWHGGCRVQHGEKWTLQQFKGRPEGARRASAPT